MSTDIRIMSARTRQCLFTSGYYTGSTSYTEMRGGGMGDQYEVRGLIEIVIHFGMKLVTTRCITSISMPKTEYYHLLKGNALLQDVRKEKGFRRDIQCGNRKHHNTLKKSNTLKTFILCQTSYGVQQSHP